MHLNYGVVWCVDTCARRHRQTQHPKGGCCSYHMFQILHGSPFCVRCNYTYYHNTRTLSTSQRCRLKADRCPQAAESRLVEAGPGGRARPALLGPPRRSRLRRRYHTKRRHFWETTADTAVATSDDTSLSLAWFGYLGSPTLTETTAESPRRDPPRCGASTAHGSPRPILSDPPPARRHAATT